MMSHITKSGKLVSIFLLGCFLFCYPILSIFNLNVIFFGIPLLYVYIFTAWIGLILLIYFAARMQIKFKRPKSSEAIIPTDSFG